MIISISLKHAKGSTGASGKAFSHENNVILRSKYGSPLLIRESNHVVLRMSIDSYSYNHVSIHESQHFADPYTVVPPGTVLSLTQDTILTE